MEKYSRIYHETGARAKDKRNYGFRYNYENGILEWVTKEDMELTETKKGFRMVQLENWTVVDCSGLDRENWKDGGQYWVDNFAEEIHQEAGFELESFRA